MDGLTRLTQIGRGTIGESWTREDFLQAAIAARNLWRATEAQFGVRYRMVTDIVSLIDPDFTLPEEMTAAIEAAPLPWARNVRAPLAIGFVKWELCPATRQHPNPYEPLVQIWEHGGSFSI